ncbi:heme ABC exporter ATP-binding protein CcmA [Silvibacterium dinghuense]|uniref:Heme ABC exporter ATP-binding protein CcmA n=1 Tax=Silvibacterium dinghuense TaxID=1560006 RepID=A0A4Q1SEC5_9BACT|nr:heme ABC exporter ATP-binding protein CcmA [Silvibacterium dinghuense]RXS95431.1 heme ABC exporter ATP-binding protein CcmA [Silvibacterium dinghuense]GGH13145.1 ABC transporter ATP-binding protein [Silvibacterium dinghuense]
MSCAVELQEVSKVYGSFAALRKVSLRFEAGCCYVLLGENGAGKSTLLRMVAGLLRPTYGSVHIVRDAAVQPPAAARHSIGYMSHAPMLYEELTALENMQYFASLYREQACLAPEEALRAVGLDPALPRAVGQFSQGMRQRASLARVLLSKPELLLLDEPFSNMDAASARQMLALVAGLRAAGKTILLTTHQRELAEPVADFLLTLQAGRVASLLAGAANGRLHTRNTEAHI